MSVILQSRKLCFIGAGSMAEAIVRGLLQQKRTRAENIVLLNRQDQSRLTVLQQRYEVQTGTVYSSKNDYIPAADIIVIATKPKDAVQALREIRHLVNEDQLLISVVAGLSINTITEILGHNASIVRTMPNTSSTIGLGATGISFSADMESDHKQLAMEIFESIGIVCAVDEHELDMVTGVSGSGPAYIYYMMESMIAAGMEGGLSEETSRILTLQTVLGAAHMVETTSEDPATLRKKVTSPGGTTQAAIETLDHYKFSEGVIKAMLRAAERAGEMGAMMDKDAKKNG